MKKITTKQKEEILRYVIERRGYLVQAFHQPMKLGTVLKQLNFTYEVRYKAQPFVIVAETSAKDFWEQNALATEFGKYGMVPSSPAEHPEYSHFYRLETD